MASKFLAVILVLGTASLIFVLRRSQAESPSAAAGITQGTGSPSAANAKLEEAVKSMLEETISCERRILKLMPT